MSLDEAKKIQSIDSDPLLPPYSFHLVSQESIIEVDFLSRRIHGATSMEIEISSLDIIPLLNFHIGFLEIRHIILNGITLTKFIDERPNFLSKAELIRDWVYSGDFTNSESSGTPSTWKCPSLVKETFHGNILPNSLYKNARPGPPLFGDLWLHVTSELLNSLPFESKAITLEIHFSLTCNRDEKLPFYPMDKNIPLLGGKGAFFYRNESDLSPFFIAGPSSNAGYLGATVSSSQVFIPIMGLHLNPPDPSVPYYMAPRALPRWKMSVSINEENVKFLGKPYSVISSGRMEILGGRQIVSFIEDDHSIIPWAIGLVIGPYCSWEIPSMQESGFPGPRIIAYAPSTCVLSTLASTMEHVEKAVEYYQWVLQIPYPWSDLKVVFTGGLLRPTYALSGGVVFIDKSFLVAPNLIDEVYESRENLFLGVAMVFGTFIFSPDTPSDLWISLGMSSFLSHSWLKRLHGENWSRMRTKSEMDRLCSVEVDSPALGIGGPIDDHLSEDQDIGNVLYGPAGSCRMSRFEGEKSSLTFPFIDGVLAEESFFNFYLLKSGLVFRAIEARIGMYAMSKTLSTLSSFIRSYSAREVEPISSTIRSDESSLESNTNGEDLSQHEHTVFSANITLTTSTGTTSSPAKLTSNSVIPINTNFFFRLIRKVSGKDLRSFADQWIYAPGHALLSVSFGLNRKKCCLELRITQTCTHPDRGAKFCGPLKIRIQESDRSYDHVVHIEEASHCFELPYHSKYKKSTTGGSASISGIGSPLHLQPIHPQEETPSLGSTITNSSVIDMMGVDESPILWIRIDPDMEWMRRILLEQPEFMWIEQLEHDRDVISQAEAIYGLSLMPSESAFSVLEKTALNWKNYHEIRSLAFASLASISSTLPHLRNDVIAQLLTFFESKFTIPRASLTEPLLPKPNSFDSFPLYFVQCSIVRMAGKIKDDHGKTPPELLRLLLQLLKLNDNSTNEFSDGFYLNIIITSLVDAIIPVSREPFCRPDPSVFKEVLDEFERYRFLDLIRPSHNNIITIALLRGLIRLQLSSLSPLDERLFSDLVLPGNSRFVREAALEGLLILRHGDVSFLYDLLTDTVHEPNHLSIAGDNSNSQNATVNKFNYLDASVLETGFLDNGIGPFSDAYSFQLFVFKSVREMLFISTSLASNFQLEQMRDKLSSLLLGSIVSRNLILFDSIMAMCQISFTHARKFIQDKQNKIISENDGSIILDNSMGIAIVSD